MKRIYLAAVVMVLAGGAVFARGTMESVGNAEAGKGAGPGSGRENAIQGETANLTGTVMEDDGKVVLETSEGIYTLSARGFRRNPVEIPFGETVTVTGTTVVCDDEDCREDGCDMDAAGHVFVASAESGSESYTFDTDRGSAGTRGNRGGRRSEDNRGSRGSRDERMGGRGNGLMDGSGMESTE